MPSLATRTKLQVKAVYKRVTLNRLTAAFFVFGFLHCFAQGIMHSFLFSIDDEYSSLLTKIVTAAQMPLKNHTYLAGSSGNYRLIMCDDIPHSDTTCSPIFQAATDVHSGAGEDPQIRGAIVTQNLASNGLNITATVFANLSSLTTVTLRDTTGRQVTLSEQCIGTLRYPEQLLHNYKREDLVWVMLQFWLFGMSLTAMIHDSVPHVLACFGARTIATMWSIYAIYRTQSKKSIFSQLIEQPGTPCSMEIFPIYYRTRLSYEIPDLILNVSAFLIVGYLSWTLHRVYSHQSFKCLGAPDHLNKIYKYFMAVQACLQLESFVLLTAMGLWIDQLFNTYLRYISTHTVAYEVGFIVTAVLLLPWIAMGWYAIKCEKRIMMAVFIGLASCIIIGWGVTFYSQVYRWTFLAWPNFGCWVVTSFILLITTIVLGIICRRNFGKGLAEYLHAESALAAMNFKPQVFEYDLEKSNEPPDFTPSKMTRGKSFSGSVIEEMQPTYMLPTLPMSSR